MANSHQVTLDTSGFVDKTRYDTTEPQLMRDFSIGLLGARKKSSETTVLPRTVDAAHEQFSPRLRGGVGKVDPTNPADLIVQVGGIELTLEAARRLGLAVPGADGRLAPTQAAIEGKLAEAQERNAQADAEALPIADPETEQFIEGLDAAAVAAGMNGAADVVFAAFRATTPQEVVEAFAAVSPDPEVAAVAFGSLVESYCETLATAMDVDVDALDKMFDAAIAVRGQSAVIAACLEGAMHRTLTPIIKVLRSRI